VTASVVSLVHCDNCLTRPALCVLVSRMCVWTAGARHLQAAVVNRLGYFGEPQGAAARHVNVSESFEAGPSRTRDRGSSMKLVLVQRRGANVLVKRKDADPLDQRAQPFEEGTPAKVRRCRPEPPLSSYVIDLPLLGSLFSSALSICRAAVHSPHSRAHTPRTPHTPHNLSLTHSLSLPLSLSLPTHVCLRLVFTRLTCLALRPLHLYRAASGS
jgi:hypothetical protein